ncbi:MAG: bifunctional lysine ketoglutarate reductase /saccharopine dehydrogenase family protein [Bacteroidales bacterium]|nr:bifunctional lysine ketoglutarate reductase /saccharopine dehydrogenase family protein [Bacteroidales bacterium]
MGIKHKIGLRFEDKYKMERRVALVPEHVKILHDQGLEFEVRKSPKRIFTDAEYELAGANVVDGVPEADIILGVKEMPINYFKENRTYLFFSHTIKGQDYNMPLLQNMMDLSVNLIDYERITDENGKRLIFFGHFAGLAGMINSLWSAGQRWKESGVVTPFLKIQQTHHYQSLDEAKTVIKEVATDIKQNGLPVAIEPMVVGITGYGNVSKGAQEILNLLPVKFISPLELIQFSAAGFPDPNLIYVVVFKEEDISAPLHKGKPFDLKEYYGFPERFENQFEKYLPHLTILMNCMYWDDRYPVIVSKDYLEILFRTSTPKLLVIGDVTCDPDGSIECTHKGTEIENPVFVYNPFSRKPIMGFKGEGILVMAVDILPSELPREASQTFSDALIGFIPELASANFDVSFEDLKIPAPLKRAMILFHGKLTPDYQYLSEFVS